jgi:hypothetical protein
MRALTGTMSSQRGQMCSSMSAARTLPIVAMNKIMQTV